LIFNFTFDFLTLLLTFWER